MTWGTVRSDILSVHRPLQSGNNGTALRNFVCPNLETLQLIRPECGRDCDISCVAASRDQYSPDPGHVVPGIEDIPFATEIDFHPRGKIRDAVGRQGSRVAQVTRAIPRRNIHTAAECDCQVGEVTADSRTLVIGLPCSPGGASILVIERDSVMYIIADRLN